MEEYLSYNGETTTLSDEENFDDYEYQQELYDIDLEERYQYIEYEDNQY